MTWFQIPPQKLVSARSTLKGAVFFLFNFFFINTNNEDSPSNFINVDEVNHIKCSCQCKRNFSDCKSNEIFNPETCLCDCSLEKEIECGEKKQVKLT